MFIGEVISKIPFVFQEKNFGLGLKLPQKFIKKRRHVKSIEDTAHT
jgi:hypothetical protein